MSNAYTYDSSDAQSLAPEGDYEAIIEKIEKRTMQVSRKEKLSVIYRVNPLVDQPYKNKVFFEDIWAEREHPEFFNRKRLNQLMGTQKDIADGREFESIDDVIDFLVGRFLIIHVTKEFDDYSGEDRNVVSYYKSSKKTGISTLPVAGEPVEPEGKQDPITAGIADPDYIPF